MSGMTDENDINDELSVMETDALDDCDMTEMGPLERNIEDNQHNIENQELNDDQDSPNSEQGKAKPLCVYEDHVIDFWKDHFQMVTLTEIMRQKDDVPFAELLNRIRVKRKDEPLTEADRSLLSQAICQAENCPKDVLHVFATNKEVNKHNADTISGLFSELVNVEAHDYRKDPQTGRMERQKAPFEGRKGDLPDRLQITEGARVMLIRNIDVEDGLVNGSFGKIGKIVYQVQNGKTDVKMIGIELDDPNAGQRHRNKVPGRSDNLVYIERMEERLSKKVDVTLDPDTAQAYLILSAAGKQVRHGNTKHNVSDNPKRFSPIVCVLGKQGFSAGKFYYEVQVKGKTGWSLGVARESITRRGKITLYPENGYWTIWLRNGTYAALVGTPVPLSLKEKPQRVGVFVDYEAGLVSFYDADCWYHLYSYANVKFTEKLYPFFSPGLNDGGNNSSPLIISSVHICPIK
ncbi:tripartite motif-containing protein 5-like [Sardina pilchardus]|uniref:tripartite motif-containing protein 5-like n=1 Tax=Sardina pilchardus TaxID=27697 RepID=UPI002E1389EB